MDFAKKIGTFLKRLEVQVILAMMLGIAVGHFYPAQVASFFWMGDIFMKLLKVLLGPLLFFSVLVAIIGLGDIKKLGGIGIRTFGYYMLTTTLAIGTSIIMMNIFKPGEMQIQMFKEALNSANEPLTFTSFVMSLIPDNIVEAFVNLNAIQVVIIGILLGISILATRNKGQIEIVEKVVKGVNDGILKFIEGVITLTPLGVFAIIAKVVTESGVEAMIQLLPFVGVIMGALFIHAVLTLPILSMVLGKFNPIEYFLKVKDAILVGFSTASSAATMGLSMNVAKNKAKVSEAVVNFTFPIGTTINMDGTALYQAGVAIFVSQAVGQSLGIGEQLTVAFIVVLASVGAAGIPGAGIIILTTVFITVGLPVEAILVVMAFDRILDMFRTGVNVWGDLITAKVIDHYYKKEKKRKRISLNIFQK